MAVLSSRGQEKNSCQGAAGGGAAKYGGPNLMTLAGDLQFYEALLNPSTERTQVRDGSFYIKFQV